MRIALLLCLASSLAYAEPSAAQRYERGIKLYKQKAYAQAAAEFRVAYELDPKPKYLYNLAQAERLAGRCEEAVVAYRELLAANPPREREKIARDGIAKCEQIIAAAQPPPPAPPPAAPEPVAIVEQQKEPDPVAPPKKVPPPPTMRVEEVREPWYRDVFGDVLLGSGVVVGALAGAAYLGARDSAKRSYEPGTLEEFMLARDGAQRNGTLAIVLGGASAVLIAGSILRYATRPTEKRIVVTPTGDGATVGVWGRF